MYGSTQDDKIGHFSKAVLKAIKWNKVIKTAMYVFDNFYMYWGESKRHITLDVSVDMCSLWNYHFITASLSSYSYIFCTSDPHHMDSHFHSISLLPSLLIRAHFGNCRHSLGCEWFPHVGLHGLFIYLIFRCSAPVQASKWAAACCILQNFKDIF